MSTRQGAPARRGSVAPPLARLLWYAYVALVVVLVAYYAVVLTRGAGNGVDFACFRSAAILFAHGGNPYDAARLWHMQDALYNAPRHLRPGMRDYYYLDRYYNPPLFHAALVPLARLPFAGGYAIYTALVVILAVVGSWLTLRALGWRGRATVTATGILLVSPGFFLAARNGQQSTLLLCALGAALYAVRRDRPALAGAVLALGWVKPHLLVPFALIAPLLLPSRRAMLRWYTGFAVATALGVALTLLLAGPASIAAWLHLLLHYGATVDSLHSYLPSLSGMGLVALPHPWNKIVSFGLTAAGLVVIVAIVVRGRCDPSGALWPRLGALLAAWLLFTPYAHVNDDVLLLLPLAAAWGSWGERGERLPRRLPQPLPFAALWAISALSLAFLLPRPWSLLGLLPPALVFLAVTRRAFRPQPGVNSRPEATTAAAAR